jgi:hypothetical protein
MRLNPFQKMSITAFQFVYLFLSMVGSANYFCLVDASFRWSELETWLDTPLAQ